MTQKKSSATMGAAARSDLVDAASALEDELRRFEDLAREAGHISLNTEKGLSRAARAVREANECRERIAGCVRALGVVIQAQQQRQETATQAVENRALEINQRAARFAEHMRTFADLGRDAGEVTTLLGELSSGAAAPGEPANDRSSTLLSRIDALMSKLVAGAERLAAEANADDMSEIAKQADALKQKISAVRGRLGLKRDVVERG